MRKRTGIEWFFVDIISAFRSRRIRFGRKRIGDWFLYQVPHEGNVEVYTKTGKTTARCISDPKKGSITISPSAEVLKFWPDQFEGAPWNDKTK